MGGRTAEKERQKKGGRDKDWSMTQDLCLQALSDLANKLCTKPSEPTMLTDFRCR